MTCSSVVKALGEWKWHVWRLQSGCLLCDTFDEGIKWRCADNVLEALNIILPVLLRSCYSYACDKPTPVQITGIGGSSDLIKSALFIRVSLGEAVKWRLKWPEEWCCDFTRWIIWPNGIPTAAPRGSKHNITQHLTNFPGRGKGGTSLLVCDLKKPKSQATFWCRPRPYYVLLSAVSLHEFKPSLKGRQSRRRGHLLNSCHPL